jgi:hypothetical protein
MNKNTESILDEVTAGIRNEQVEPATVKQAAERVWERLAAENVELKNIMTTTGTEHIENCADFQSLIPAYLNNELSEARSLLLVDHTHECIPCRRAMKEARTRSVAPTKTVVAPRRYSLQPVILRWGIAAAVVIGFGLLALPFIQRYAPFGGELEATVQAAEGQVYQIADTTTSPIIAGEKLSKGERVRTAKGAHAMLRLGDGTMIEMRDRSELSLTKNGQGTTIHLNRGDIMVDAAQQNGGRLFVDTGDALVSVTGTIFSVANGTKGSRVSVVSGEVNLDHKGNERVIRAGEQLTTNPSIETIPVKDDVSWSRNAANYAQTLAALSGLNKELNKVQQPGVRNSTHLLDLMPENTVVYAALPNLTATIAESHRIMQERMNQNPALRQWYEKEQSGHHGPGMDQVIGTVREFGEYLGDEVAVSLSMNSKGEPDSTLVLAELKNSAGFRQFLEQQIAKYAGNQQGKPSLQFVDDPLTATAAAPEAGKKNDRVYVWINNNLFAASPKLDQLQALAGVTQKGGGSPFTGTAFHNRIAQVYKEGAGLVVAANLEQLIEKNKSDLTKGEKAAEHAGALQQLGILNLKHFALDQKDSQGKTHTRAVLSFNEARGIPSWLAEPGPMGSLEYISPDANVVAGFVVKNPVSLVDDLLGVMETVSPDLRKNLDKLQAERGLDIRRDFAAPLGGEFAFAIDGPILPTPSWKMVFEVNDPQHLQQTLERVVAEVNKEAAKFGKTGLVWDRSEISGRAYYTLRSADFGLEVNLTYVNGYMIAGPSRALVERAVRLPESGYSLLRSARFTAGLPADGNANFSAVFYHNLGPLVQPFADRIAGTADKLPKEQAEAIKNMAADMPPTLAYAYAHGDSITFAANTEGGPFGLSPASLLGMPNALEIQHILSKGMGRKN